MGKTEIKHALKTMNVDEPLANISIVRTVLNMLVLTEIQEGNAEKLMEMYNATFDIMFDYLEKTEKICENNVRTYQFISTEIEEVLNGQ
ncbi:MAG: hypothetical protein ACRC90_06005 [Lactococcus garvieae]